MSAPTFLQSEPLAGLPGIRHGFFTRHGGVSTGIYESLNVGRGSRDNAEHVRQNRARVASALGAGTLNTAYQIHSATVIGIEGDFGATSPEADGLVTVTPGVLCGALAADCAPILLADPVARVVAAVHAGWRGALQGVAEAAISEMTARGARVERIVAAVGPCIGPASYEVGAEFQAVFEDAASVNRAFFHPLPASGKALFDLPGFVLDRLGRAGVEQREWLGRDTLADEAFFSHRRSVHHGEPDYGRLVSAIMLEP